MKKADEELQEKTEHDWGFTTSSLMSESSKKNESERDWLSNMLFCVPVPDQSRCNFRLSIFRNMMGSM